MADASSSFAYGYVDHSQNLLQSITGPVHTVTNTFEANRDALLTKANRRNSDASDISSIGYTVNAIGQRTHATRTGAATNSTDWGYDSLGQVVQADDSVNTSDRAYQYDTIGNRQKSVNGLLGALPTAPNYVANALNQYTTIPQAPSAPVYDFDGNLTAGPLPVSPTANSKFTWDAENRLIETQVGRNNTLIRYQYDAQSRRISKTVNGAATLYLYDGFNGIADYTFQNASFILHTSRLWGMDLSGTLQGAGGVGGLLCESQITNAQSSDFFTAYDGNGNITEYLSPTGTLAAHFAYDPFGNTLVNTDAGSLFPYRFSTKPIDSETGLYYYNYRYYDPATGRWLSRDPIGEWGGVNLYNFLGNSPLLRVDVNGEYWNIIAGAVIGAVIGRVSSGSWEGALAGALGGAVTAATFNPAAGAEASALVVASVGSGGLGGLVSGLTQQSINAAQGEGFDASEVAKSTAIGAVSGLATGGVCAGKADSFNAVEKAASELTEQVAGVTIGTVSTATESVINAK